MVCLVTGNGFKDPDSIAAAAERHPSELIPLEQLEGFARMKLAGKVAIVTGGGTGIGLGISRVLASHGAKIAVAQIDTSRCPFTDSEMRKAAMCDVSGGRCRSRSGGPDGGECDPRFRPDRYSGQQRSHHGSNSGCALSPMFRDRCWTALSTSI